MSNQYDDEPMPEADESDYLGELQAEQDAENRYDATISHQLYDKREADKLASLPIIRRH